MIKKIKAGIIGATGMVGQRFISLLANHEYFEVSVLAASPSSAGKKYSQAVENRWKMQDKIPENIKDLIVLDAGNIKQVADLCDFVFCAVDLPKDKTRELEEAYAKTETPVISNNSACRNLFDVPMLVPEINAEHCEIINAQKKRLGTKNGFIAVKPNCSIQSYAPMLTPLIKFGLSEVLVSTYQAISGAGKTFDEWEEMRDNVIPFIGGEEEKSELEPLKIWGKIEDNKIIPATLPKISAQCIRVPVTNGHLATVAIRFANKNNMPSKQEIIKLWKDFKGEPQELNLPNAPKQFIYYFEEDNKPQTKFERELENGMAISAGRLREDNIFDYKFVGLSHNTLRGAAGGAVLMAEYLYRKGFIVGK